MSTHRTDRDDDLMRLYREASVAADEQPAASARAAILAAAAREVHAKPTDAKLPYRRARWPLAAAAAVMLSTLAVMLAIRTGEELPQFEAPPEAGSASRAPATPATEKPQQVQKAVEEAQPQPKPAREQLPPSPADGARQAADATSEPKRAFSAGMRAKTETTDQPIENRANENRLQESARAPTAVSPPVASRTSSPAPDAAAPPAPASAPAPLAKQRADAEADIASQRLGRSAAGIKPQEPKPMAQAPAAASAERGSDARRDASRTLPSPSRTDPAVEAARDEAEGSAATWLERIIRLRREGRHDEAEAELKRFRERYPQVQVPPQALPPIVRP